MTHRPPWREWTPRDWAMEVFRQCWTQPLHTGWTTAAVLPAFYFGEMMLSDGGKFWSSVGLFLGMFWAGAWICVIGLREFDQWPSERPWDPWLDWFFFGCGGPLGVWAGITLARSWT